MLTVNSATMQVHMSTPTIRGTLLTGVLSLLFAFSANANSLIQPNDHLAFCGDGMTGGPYTGFMEKYLIACQSIPGLDMKQFGWSAETPDAFLARLDKDLSPYKPTVVTLLYNFADTGDKPLDDAVNARRDSETQLIEALKKVGVRAIVLGSPPCVDSTHYHHDAAQATAFNTKLATVAATDKDVAAKEGVAYADVFGATTDAMAKAKEKLGADYNFAGDDFRQPQEGCSVAIAYAFLKALAPNGDLGTFTINFTPDYVFDKADAAGDPKILSSTPLSLMVAATRYTFCIPGDSYPDILMSCLPFYEDLSSLKLVVKGLPGPMARVYWNENSTWHDFTSEDLAKGAQLPGNMAWPFGGKFEELDRNINNQMDNDATAGKAAATGTPNPGAEAAAADELAKAKAWVVPVQYFLRVFPLVNAEKPPTSPVNVIVDTDMASDCDDVGALALLNDFMCQGECNLIACNTNVRNGDSGATVQAINAYYGHPSIPIGSYLGEAGPATKMTSVLLPAPPEGYHGEGRKDGSHYTVQIHKQFDPDFPNDDQLPAGVDVYRKALASAPDGSVSIVTIGLMPNLQDLIQSQPDSVSDLSGLDLVRKKVRALVIMANTVPQDGYLLGKWPTRILWTTDAGSYVGTGQSLINTPENNPVRVAYGLFGDSPEHNALKDSRASWDLTAAWLAVRGSDPFWDVLAGRQQYINDITKTPFAGHPNEITITAKMPVEQVAKIINVELARPPK
jgi:lysophospholipase L1-like esterase